MRQLKLKIVLFKNFTKILYRINAYIGFNIGPFVYFGRCNACQNTGCFHPVANAESNVCGEGVADKADLFALAVKQFREIICRVNLRLAHDKRLNAGTG